jgi:hypothetical protein
MLSWEALAAPGVPSALVASVSGSTATLSWSAAGSGEAAASYVIEAGTASGATDIASFDTASSATAFTATGVPQGTYFVRVRGKNGAGMSAASNEARLVVGSVGGTCDAAPNSPTNLTSSLDGSRLTLSWNAPQGGCPPESYIVEAGSSADTSDIANFDTGNTGTMFFADLGSALTSFDPWYRVAAPASGTFYVRVKARNKRGRSAPSNTTSFTRGAAPPPPPLTCDQKYRRDLQDCEINYPPIDRYGNRPGYWECRLAAGCVMYRCKNIKDPSC